MIDAHQHFWRLSRGDYAWPNDSVAPIFREFGPDDLLPQGSGLIRADSWGADLLRMAPESRLAAARRTRLLRDIARVSAGRLLALTDPMGVSGAAF